MAHSVNQLLLPSKRKKSQTFCTACVHTRLWLGIIGLRLTLINHSFSKAGFGGTVPNDADMNLISFIQMIEH
jgi:hypothetical protein